MTAGHRVSARLTRALTLITAGALIASISLTSTAFADSPGQKLSKQDRTRLATAVANNAPTVTVLFATVESSTGAVANAVRALGATVRKQDVDVGYIRADVPTDKVDLAMKIAGVVAAELDQVFDIPTPDVGDGAAPEQLPPDNTTPARNAYMPTQDTGAPQFVVANPTWDGRGTKIGILDTGIDIGHWALQQTTTGERKIVDWISYTDPATDLDPSWISMAATVKVVDGSFTVGTGTAAKTWTGAPAGNWRFGSFNEDNVPFARADGSAAAEYRASCSNRPVTPPTTPPSFQTGGDLNRNNICGETFAFLWDGQQNGFVWRDSDADGSFADETGMREYKKDFAIGEYGHDNPSTAIRESVPFVTQIHAATGFVSLGVVSGAHGTHVAGIAAGNRLFRNAAGTATGDATGAAPGAQIVSIRVCLFTSGCTAHALTEGMIYAAKDANVDVISMSIGGLPNLNDGNNARAILYNRLIDKWGAQIFLSAGNSGPGVNTIGDPAVATKAMAVGAYWTKDSVFANYGNTVPSAEALHDFSSRGPREDGGLKPEIVAPGNATSSVPTWQAGQCLSVPNCSAGLGMFNGTSMAAPQASGAAALLLSAAKQSEVGHQPAQLRAALTSSARFIANYKAHEQGFGLIQVGQAWDLLKQNLKTVDITSSVPVNTLLGGFLATPNHGAGIHDREGVTVGSAPYQRRYTFTRSDGGRGNFNLSWLGNDGTFSSAGTLQLAGKGSATLDVTVTPGAAGVHSALLLLDDPTTPGIEFATLNTVVVSIALDSSNNWTSTVASSATRFESARPEIFFTVPTGATALRNTVTLTNGGRIRWFRMHPWGAHIDPSSTGFFGVGLPGASQTRTTQVSPLPGTWELAVAASRADATTNNDAPPGQPPVLVTRNHPPVATFTASATAYKVSLEPASVMTAPGVAATRTFTATNEFASGIMGGAGSPLASTFTKTTAIGAAGPQQEYPISVGGGSTQLVVTLGGATDPAADLDLFVYDCTNATAGCVLRGQGVTSSSNETVTINAPTGGTLAAGAWKAVVDPFAVPAGTTTYTYTDSIANPAYGAITTNDTFVNRASGGVSWTFNATATPGSTPAGEGRFLRGRVLIRLDNPTNGAILNSAVWDLKPE
jgi:subtilisin family serine protease